MGRRGRRQWVDWWRAWETRREVLEDMVMSEMKASEVRRYLTRREMEVYNLRRWGCTVSDVAARLGLARQTVKNYVTAINRKLAMVGRPGPA